MPTRGSLTPADVVFAAIAYADENGIDALTLRSLGDSIGMHHTAVYRHFRSKDELLSAMVDAILDEALALIPEVDDPSSRMRGIAAAIRRVLGQHPNLIVPVISSAATMPSALALSKLAIEALAAGGLTGARLVDSYRLLESYIFGSAIFDFSRGPNYLENRRLRYRMLGMTAFDDLTRTIEQVDDLNEQAFARGFDVLLASCWNDASGS